MKHQSLPNQTHRNQFFQFLWGWNISCMKLNIWSLYSAAFQFLWGWNHNGENMSRRSIQLSIPLRMKPMWSRSTGLPPPSFQFLWGWNKCVNVMAFLYILIYAFNSFEDETVLSQPGGYYVIYFQFLWGWNILDEDADPLVDLLIFQFLWGWNGLHSCCVHGVVGLSIPLRMKP